MEPTQQQSADARKEELGRVMETSLASRVSHRHAIREQDPYRQDFEERAKAIIRWIRFDEIAWLNRHQVAAEKPAQYAHTSKPLSDAIKAADAFVGHLFGQDNWVDVGSADWRLNQVVPKDHPMAELIDTVQRWAQEVSRWLTDHYRYGTYMVIQSSLALDTHTFGNSVTYTGYEGGEIVHRRCNILDTYIKNGCDLLPRQIHYVERWMAGEAYEEWGDKLSDATCRAAVSEPSREVEVIRCVYPAYDAILTGAPFGIDSSGTDPLSQFVEILIEKNSAKNAAPPDPEDPLCGILAWRKCEDNPFQCWPYFLTAPEDAYGWSAYGLTLTSIRRLNIMHKSVENAAALSADPSMKTTLSPQYPIDLRPGHFTRLASGADILEETFKRPPQYPFGIDFIERMEGELEQVLHLPLYEAMTRRTHEMRVDEVLEVIGEKVRMLSPRIGTRQYCFDNQINDATLSLAQANKLGPVGSVPAEMVRFLQTFKGSPKLRYRYKGPLAQWNELSMLTRALNVTLGMLAQLAGIGEKAAQEVQDNVKAGELAEYIMDHSSLPQSVIATKDEKKAASELRERILALQEQAAQAQIANTASQASRNTMQAASMAAGVR